MKILIDSYNNVMQNTAGGVQNKITQHVYHLNRKEITTKLFNKWEDKITDFDLLHIFKINIEVYHLALLAKKKRIPIVISSVIPLDKGFNIKINIFISKYLKLLTGYKIIKNILDISDCIIAETSIEKNFIQKFYKISECKILTIPCGLNSNMNYEVSNKKIYDVIPINKPYILQVGRFDKNKNQLNVIRALNNTDIPVVFIGGADPLDLEYYEQCKNEASKNFHFLGWIKQEDTLLSSAYTNAHVTILPSFKEIFGNSLFEGGAAGANLVITQSLPIKDWGLDKYCDQLNPFDINDIRNKLIIAYHKEKNPNISKFITDNFSWEKVIEEHIELYKKLING